MRPSNCDSSPLFLYSLSAVAVPVLSGCLSTLTHDVSSGRVSFRMLSGLLSMALLAMNMLTLQVSGS